MDEGGLDKLDEQLLAALARGPEADGLGEWLAANPAMYAEWLFEFRRLKERFYASEKTSGTDRGTLAVDWGPRDSRATVFRLRPGSQ